MERRRVPNGVSNKEAMADAVSKLYRAARATIEAAHAEKFVADGGMLCRIGNSPALPSDDFKIRAVSPASRLSGNRPLRELGGTAPGMSAEGAGTQQEVPKFPSRRRFDSLGTEKCEFDFGQFR
jgi:hypothetical protein